MILFDLNCIFEFLFNSLGVKYIFLLISFLLVGCGVLHQPRKVLKILSYNIRNARGMDDVTDYDRIADVIKRVNADCVALQELDSATQRSNGVVVLNELAKRTGMHATYNKSIDYQGGGYGIGVLTKEKPVRKTAIPLPGSEERRSLLVVEMPDYVICSTHWSLTQEDRVASVNVINEFLKNYTQKPVFLAGDLNAVSATAEMAELTEKWTILNDQLEPTIPSTKPTKCIDYVLALKNPMFTFNVSETKVENEPVASDHLPVWVKINISKQK